MEPLLETQLRLAVAEARQQTPDAESKVTLVRRETPIVSPLLSAQAALGEFAGQTPSRSFGPFADALGRKVWFDEFLVRTSVQISWAGGPGVVLVLPSTHVLPGATHLEFGAGSVWVAARSLAAGAPAGAYAGWKIEKATLELSAAGELAGNLLTLPANATCNLTIIPDDTELAASGPGPGVDANEASVRRPAWAVLFFDANGLATIRAEAAEIHVFGAHAALTRREEAPLYDATVERVWIPFTPDPIELPDLTTASTLCTITGSGSMEAAGWCPALSKARPDQLGDAGSGGMIALAVIGNIAATGAGLERGPLRLGRTFLLADRGIVGAVAPSAENRASSYSLSLWPDSQLHLATEEPFVFLFLSSRTGMELVQYRGTLSASFDQPKQADGSRLPMRFANATMTLAQTAAGVSASGSVGAQAGGGRTALALANGLFTVTPALQLDWQAQLSSPAAAVSGSVQLLFGIYQLLPMLPDPYAANFDPDFRADAPRGRLLVRASWAGGPPQLEMTVLSGRREDGSPEVAPPPRSTPVADGNAERLREIFHEFVHDRAFLAFDPNALRDLRLLDVSTNADQMGIDIGYTAGRGADVQVRGMDVVSFGGLADVLMLPQMQWEPVQILQNPDVGKLPDYLAHPDDGGPTLVGAHTVRLTPVAPMPLVAAVVGAHNETAERTAAFFTLPFGIRAVATLDPTRSPLGQRAGIQIFRTAFVDSFTSATQVRLTAAPARLRASLHAAGVTLVREPPLLPGAAIQTVHATDQFGTSIVYAPPPPPAPPLPKKPPPFSVLDPIDQDFNLTFGPSRPGARVPIERIDLCGYGASCFSDWWHDQPIGITNVRFEVLTGRTRYEVIRMKSLLGPCGAVVVRTITLERRGSGNVFRWDSGWQPVTDGLFEWPDASVQCHTGAVRGFYNIRHIRDTPGTITLDGGNAEVELVYFDTDVEIDHAIKGATSGKRVPSLGQLGFVQRIPRGLAPAKPLNQKQFREVLERFDPVGGAIDCVVDIGGSGQEMRIASAICSPAPKGAGTEFAVACYGSLTVPRNEQWSVVRIHNGDEVTAVDSHRGVPLIRVGGTPHKPPSGNYRIADPQDLFNASPNTDYGLQLTTRTNRLLFPRPEIPDKTTRITGTLPPVLADPYSLVGVGGPFPPLKRCLHLDAAPYTLELAGGVFRWKTPAGGLTFNIPDLGGSKRRFLIKSGAFDLFADYGASTVQIAANQVKPWGINIPKVPAALDVKVPFSAPAILQVLNDLATPDLDGLPVPNPPEVQFGAILKDAQEVITALKAFLPDAPPIRVDLSTPQADDPGLRLLIAARFPIAKPDGSAIDIGIGKFRGEIGVGTEVRLTLASFGGRIFFTVGGELQQPLLPKIAYVGGSMNLELSIDQTGKPVVRLVTSAVASVGGDLIPGLVELEGSVSYGAFLDTSRNPFLPGVALGMELRAKLLSGLVGVRFRADAAVGVMPLPGGLVGGKLVRDVLIQGQIRAMGSVVAAWVLEEDFDKTLQFEQKVPGLVAGAFLVATGLVPVPV